MAELKQDLRGANHQVTDWGPRQLKSFPKKGMIADDDFTKICRCLRRMVYVYIYIGKRTYVYVYYLYDKW